MLSVITALRRTHQPPPPPPPILPVAAPAEELFPPPATATEDSEKDKGSRTLFGPALGKAELEVDPTAKAGKGQAVGVETVREWVRRSKDPTTITTTLQALTNLKRNTLRLLPHPSLSASSGTERAQSPTPTFHTSPSRPASPSLSIAPASSSLHTLRFTFDCASPKCGVRFAWASEAEGEDVWEGVVDGGWEVEWTAPEEEVRLDLAARERVEVLRSEEKRAREEEEKAKGEEKKEDAQAGETPVPALVHEGGRKIAWFRRKTPPAAPATPTTDQPVATSSATLAEDASTTSAPAADDTPVVLTLKVTLTAYSAEGIPLCPHNSQTTHLQIIRASNELQASSSDFPPPVPARASDDVWISRVSLRTASIGSHSFTLHEIYGLSTHSSSSPPPAPTTYPPAAAPASTAPEDHAGGECIICLAAARDVLLLPCRHLVACRDCAVRMTEFGGGGVSAREGGVWAVGTDPVVNAEAGVAGGPEAAAAQAVGDAAPQTTAGTGRRRRKKARGWFCPVCRQPYTAMLRIALTSSSPATAAAVAAEHAHAHADAEAAAAKKLDDDDDDDSVEGAPAAAAVPVQTTAPEPIPAPAASPAGESAAQDKGEDKKDVKKENGAEATDPLGAGSSVAERTGTSATAAST